MDKVIVTSLRHHWKCWLVGVTIPKWLYFSCWTAGLLYIYIYLFILLYIYTYHISYLYTHMITYVCLSVCMSVCMYVCKWVYWCMDYVMWHMKKKPGVACHVVIPCLKREKGYYKVPPFPMANLVHLSWYIVWFMVDVTTNNVFGKNRGAGLVYHLSSFTYC
jgi:hypothetical protein